MWKCMECGRKFKTTKAAERALNGDGGCPGCGGSDIDLDDGIPWPVEVRDYRSTEYASQEDEDADAEGR